MTTAPAWIHPYDSQCPRAVSKLALPILRLASAMSDEMPDCLQKWQAALAIGTNNLAGRTLADIAAKARVTELELLKGATKFCQRHNVHPSPYLQKFAADHAAKKKRGVPGERHDKITADAIL
jgi:hypothetical protein